MRKASLALICLALIILGHLCAGSTQTLGAGNGAAILRHIGPRDAVILSDPKGKILVARNTNTQLIPASTLKILTSLAALHYLGPHFRFVTDFYGDADSNLKVKGYGDPFLVSETIAHIAGILKSKTTQCNHIVLDDSFFGSPLLIPGVTASSEPYDAPNGALCVNFNSVYFKRTNQGRYISAEPQTPLLPFALQFIRQTALPHGRIIIPGQKNQHTLYAGHLLNYFLNKAGVPTRGKVKLGKIREPNDRLLWRHVAPMQLNQIITNLLEYSNNFIANQILIATGAHRFDPPGSLAKGIRAMLSYLKEELHLTDIHLAEGSGISRQNRFSAAAMHQILLRFEPYHRLLPHAAGEYYKTGSLHGIRTRVGYIEAQAGGLYHFVVFLNTAGKRTEPIMDQIHGFIKNAH